MRYAQLLLISMHILFCYMQVVANGDIADAPASAGNLADLLSLDATDDAASVAATASSAVTALQDLLSGDLSADVDAAGKACSVLLSAAQALCNDVPMPSRNFATVAVLPTAE